MLVGISKRVITIRDLPAMIELFNRYESSVFGEIQTGEDEIRNMLNGIPETDRIGLFQNGDLSAASILTVKDHRLPALVIAEPNEKMGQYITMLLNELISSAKAKKKDGQGDLIIILSANIEVEKRSFETCGFTPARYWFQMKKELGSLPDPTLPAVYRISSFQPASDTEKLHEAFEEVFSDHFDYHPSTLQDFKKRFQTPAFDPNLWYLLWKGDTLVGFAFSAVNEETKLGEITHIGIRRNWRRNGLAHDLLHQAFQTLKDYGMTTAALAVDSSSPTEATIVYQKAGMYVYRGYTRYDLNV
ncbi:GNAT family N-acetyltransferase [Bacillus sp. KH172YL63]|uniref:GNAT family N-acetyltransferase n=1 Tax=Bacillus sp. KH172YL63 TaxID=2709784 RepID=UPI0013E4BD9B|nr:GNAT family N-acetyltransferase [Bacillus sp. KH172YL63]BCB04282.1 hypothetical protein KH172YL63_24150 [Bacillus sp. KH172YL63]